MYKCSLILNHTSFTGKEEDLNGNICPFSWLLRCLLQACSAGIALADKYFTVLIGLDEGLYYNEGRNVKTTN